MEMMNVMYELATTKTALELAEKTIRKQKGKLLRRNILIAGLAWLGFTACRMLGESDEKLKKVEAKARDTEAELAMIPTVPVQISRERAERRLAVGPFLL